MPTEALKSASITNLDANPPVRGTSGKDGFGRRMEQSDYASPLTGATSPSVYRLVRVPTNARNLQVEIESHGTITTLTGDTTIYYSDLAADEVGLSQGVGSGVVNSLSTTSSLFGSATAMATADTPVNVTNKAGNYDVTKRSKELWDAAGLTVDPGGFFDVCFVTTATNSLTNGATIAARVSYQPGFLS